MTKVAIIGTAGRTADDLAHLNADKFQWMVDMSKQYIASNADADPSAIELVSGGAAWSDHAAVRLYLTRQYKSLTLYLPCAFDTAERRFVGGPADAVNRYHREFSNYLGRQSLDEIADAIAAGATVVVRNGFFERNHDVARVDVMIAFTTSSAAFPLKGGTFDTWNKCKARNKKHFCIA